MRLNYKYIIAGSLLFTGFTSCKKGWLDVTSNTQIRAEEQFETESGFKDALMGAYIGMTDPSLYSRDMTWNLVDLLAQQYNTLVASAAYAPVQAYLYQSTRAMPQIDAIWNNSYAVIANVNKALEEIDKKQEALKPINYALIKGELLGLRAFLHFDLIRLYGYGNLANRPDIAVKPTIPYVTSFSKEATPQLSYAETFRLMEADAAAAADLLKEDPVYAGNTHPDDYYDEVNMNGFYNNRQLRMNYYAVKALQARIYLWQGGTASLEKARTAAQEVIAQAPAHLIAPEASVAADRTLPEEHIFSLNVMAFEDIILDYFDAATSGNTNALILLPQKAQELYETQNTNIGLVDKRYTTLLESQTYGMAPVKLKQSYSSINQRNIMPLIKMPEMYYITAESYLDTDLPQAIDYLNTVRSSRGIIEEIDAGADRAAVEDELYKEYRKEFIAEGQLFFYYKRKGLTTFPGLSVNTTANDALYVLPYPNSETDFGRVQ